MKDPSSQEQIALFRYGLIAPILYETTQKQNQYCREIAKQRFNVPNQNHPKSFAVSTIKSWLAKYRLHSIKGLYPQKRCDSGRFVVISDTVKQKTQQMITEIPKISAAQIYRQLVLQGLINPKDFTPGTLRHYVQVKKLREILPKTPRKKFETSAVNQLWMTDFMHGPYVYDSSDHNSKKKTYLCAIIDDHSRFIVGAKFFFAENTFSLAQVFKSALQQYGLTRKLYCDNGAAFSTSFLHLVCANSGIALIHSQPYDSPSRGKIERFFKTVRIMFLISFTSHCSLDQLNTEFSSWLNQQYHQNIHAGIQDSPHNRFLHSVDHTRIHRKTQEELDAAFLVQLSRKVKKDSTISVKGKLFEVPCQYIGATIDCRYPIDQPTLLTLYEKDRAQHSLRRINLIDNAYSPTASIKFSQESDR